MGKSSPIFGLKVIQKQDGWETTFFFFRGSALLIFSKTHIASFRERVNTIPFLPSNFRKAVAQHHGASHPFGGIQQDLGRVETVRNLKANLNYVLLGEPTL